MQPVSAVYTRINSLLQELDETSQRLYSEVSMLKDKMKFLGISWEGAAYDEYSRVLAGDLMIMEITALNVRIMYRLLLDALTGYQHTELMVSEMIGGTI